MEKDTINIRIDGKLRQEAEDLFEGLGLSLGEAIAMFLEESIAHDGIPFKAMRETPNLETRKAMDEVEYMKEHPDEYESYHSFEEIMEELDEGEGHGNLGLLLSEECPFTIKVAYFQGTNSFIFRDRREFGGSLISQFEKAELYLDIFNKVKGTIDGLQRTYRRDYPPFAIRESLLNAIIHRDYSLNGSILVSVYDDRLEITSLGGLMKGLTIPDLLVGVSLPRNKNLSEVFMRLGYVESFGTGIRKIMESYAEDERKPSFIATGNAFKVTLPNRNYEMIAENGGVGKKLEKEEAISSYLEENAP